MSNVTQLMDELTENISIHAGAAVEDIEKFRPVALEILKQFQAAHRRDPVDYFEIEQFFLERQKGGHLRSVKP